MGKRGPKPKSTAERFWKFAAIMNDSRSCWAWLGGTDPKTGRGKFIPYGKKMTQAYRVAWELTYGAIPSGLQVCHRCDNPNCVRPDHLFLGTQSDNLRDAVQKGRQRPASLPGMKNPNAKLTEENIAAIRASNATAVDLAPIYNVCVEQIRRVRRKENWI